MLPKLSLVSRGKLSISGILSSKHFLLHDRKQQKNSGWFFKKKKWFLTHDNVEKPKYRL